MYEEIRTFASFERIFQADISYRAEMLNLGKTI